MHHRWVTTISVHNHFSTWPTFLWYTVHFGTWCPFRYIRRLVHGLVRYITTSIYKVAFKWREGMCGAHPLRRTPLAPIKAGHATIVASANTTSNERAFYRPFASACTWPKSWWEASNYRLASVMVRNILWLSNLHRQFGLVMQLGLCNVIAQYVRTGRRWAELQVPLLHWHWPLPGCQRLEVPTCQVGFNAFIAALILRFVRPVHISYSVCLSESVTFRIYRQPEFTESVTAIYAELKQNL